MWDPCSKIRRGAESIIRSWRVIDNTFLVGGLLVFERRTRLGILKRRYHPASRYSRVRVRHEWSTSSTSIAGNLPLQVQFHYTAVQDSEWNDVIPEIYKLNVSVSESSMNSSIRSTHNQNRTGWRRILIALTCFYCLFSNGCCLIRKRFLGRSEETVADRERRTRPSDVSLREHAN